MATKSVIAICIFSFQKLGERHVIIHCNGLAVLVGSPNFCLHMGEPGKEANAIHLTKIKLRMAQDEHPIYIIYELMVVVQRFVISILTGYTT